MNIISQKRWEVWESETLEQLAQETGISFLKDFQNVAW